MTWYRRAAQRTPNSHGSQNESKPSQWLQSFRIVVDLLHLSNMHQIDPNCTNYLSFHHFPMSSYHGLFHAKFPPLLLASEWLGPASERVPNRWKFPPSAKYRGAEVPDVSRCIMSQQLLRMWSHPQLYDLSSDTGIWFSGASLYVPHICSWQDVQPAWNAHLEAEYFYLALSFAMVRSKSKHSSLDSAKLSILERSCRADLDNRAASFQAMLKTTSLSLLILQYVLGRFCSDSSFKIFQVPISALDFPSISIRICCQPFLWSQPPWDWRLSSFIPLSCPKILQSCRFCSRQTFQESA